jgi:nicotinamidase-related amidase
MSANELLLSLPGRIAPAHTAVLVVDMQNDFCAPGGWIETVSKKDTAVYPAVAQAIAELVRNARNAKIPVLWVRADYSPDKVPETMRARAAKMGATGICCEPGTWGADWFGERPAPGEAVYTKHCYSGFVGTELDADLKKRGVRTLVFAGVQTHICVESTLRDAHSLGYYCVLAGDCVASHAPAAQEQTLAHVRALFGDVASFAELVQIWKAI